MTLLKVCRDMDAGCTVHGFRSSFRDWAAEETTTPEAVCEAALAHTVEDRVLKAYRRTDFFEKRRKLMAAWGKYLDQFSAGVIPFPAGRHKSSSAA
jgi:integrase